MHVFIVRTFSNNRKLPLFTLAQALVTDTHCECAQIHYTTFTFIIEHFILVEADAI